MKGQRTSISLGFSFQFVDAKIIDRHLDSKLAKQSEQSKTAIKKRA